MSDNPFKLVYDAIWGLAERNSDLTDIIKLNNRIKYDKPSGDKRSISDADTPELSLVVEGSVSNLQASSSHSEIVRRHAWELTTGEIQLDQYHEISFQLFRSMIDWDKYLCGLQWEHSPGEFVQIVQRVDLLETDDGTEMTEQNRRIRGWASIWAVEVLMMIPTETLRIPEP